MSPSSDALDGAGPRGPRLEWNAAWGTFSIGEWIATGASIATLIGSRVVPQPEQHWKGQGILFDEVARDHLRVGGLSGRRWARDASDIGLVVAESWPFFDAIVVAAWYRQSPEVGWQQGLITAEVLAVTAAIQGVTALFVGRERPYGRDCGDFLPLDSRDCKSTDRYFSFFSGHTSQAFAATTVNCMHHAYVPLYGGGTPDQVACVAGLTIAAATAFMRVGTDFHYTTDVLAGALMGSATGVLIPWLLHYRHGAPVPAPDQSPNLSVAPMGLGLQGVLIF